MLVPRDPTAYAQYQTSRSNLALSSGQLIDVNPIGLPNFGVHSGMPEVASLFQTGHAAFIANVGTLIEPVQNRTQVNQLTKQLPLGLYSHSDQIEQWQTSVPNARSGIGWAGRTADLLRDINTNQVVPMNISLDGGNVWQTGNNVAEYAITTDGAVTVGTVTAQLLYEIGGPRYLGPDVTTRLDTIELAQVGPDRVSVSGVRGEAPPSTVKVSLNYLAGLRNEINVVLTGLDVDAKAALFTEQFEAALPTRPESMEWTLSRLDRPDAATEEQASALLRCVVRDTDPSIVGRTFTSTAVELALASYPGFTMTAPPGNGSPYGVFEPGYVDAAEVEHRVAFPSGVVQRIDPSPLRGRPAADEPTEVAVVARDWGPTRSVPLGLIAGARSGDKGGSANIGVWVRDRDQFDWLNATLDVDLLRSLLPEVAELTVHRYPLPNLLAINFVIEGILGRGVADNVRFDPQAKGLGEWLRSRNVDVPERFLGGVDG